LAANAPCFQEGLGTYFVGQPLLAVRFFPGDAVQDSQECLSYEIREFAHQQAKSNLYSETNSCLNSYRVCCDGSFAGQ
jgi:hypothetical protein